MRRPLPVPERLLPPPAPTGAAGDRWARLPFATRRRLAARLDGGEIAPTDEEMVRALAQRRLATLWRLRAGSVVLAWLVLMTVWGYGRASTGATVSAWLWLGLVGGILAAGLHSRATSRRVRRWQSLAGRTRQAA